MFFKSQNHPSRLLKNSDSHIINQWEQKWTHKASKCVFVHFYLGSQPETQGNLIILGEDKGEAVGVCILEKKLPLWFWYSIFSPACGYTDFNKKTKPPVYNIDLDVYSMEGWNALQEDMKLLW